jgi:hypothetical protein
MIEGLKLNVKILYGIDRGGRLKEKKDGRKILSFSIGIIDHGLSHAA